MTIIIKKYIRYVLWSGALQRRVPAFFAHHWVLCKMHVCPELSKSEMRTLRSCSSVLMLGFLFTAMGVSTHSYAALSQGSVRSRVQQTSSESFQRRRTSFQNNFLRQRMQICASGLKFWMLRIDTEFGQCMRCTWADRLWTKVSSTWMDVYVYLYKLSKCEKRNIYSRCFYYEGAN